MAVEAGIVLPPDSSGKKITMQRNTALFYASATEAFRINDIVTGQTSGAIGRVYHTDSVVPIGHIHVVQIKGSQTDFTDGENLLRNNVTASVLSSKNSIYSQTNIIVGQNNPNNGQFVDSSGAAYTRFNDGPQQLDPHGRTKISQEVVLAEYMHTNDIQPNQYYDTTSAGGTLSHEYITGSALLTTGTALGDAVSRTTHRRHKYFLSNGTIVKMVVGNSDAGKADNIRRWGPYDNEGGVFFQSSSAGLQIVVRSSTSGTTVDIPTNLSDVTGDPVNGLGVSGFALDVSKINAYWFDIHWGVRARVGIINGRGERIVIHDIVSTNIYSYSLARTASLPIRYENINTGITSSASTLKVLYATVSTEGKIDTTFLANYGGGLRTQLQLGDTLLPVLGIRSKLLINGYINQNHVIPINFSVILEDSNAQIMIVQLPTSVTGDTWNSAIGSAEIDNTATAISGGRIMASYILGPGSHTIDMKSIYDISSTCLRLTADGLQTQSIWLIAKKIGTVVPKITASMNWQEVV